jgi:ribosomal protein S18 acetylase RimI-like enzyme
MSLIISSYSPSIHDLQKPFEYLFGEDEYKEFKYEVNAPSVVLLKDNFVKGFLLLNNYKNENKKYYINQLGVVPKYRKQGYATKMLDKVKEISDYLELDTFQNNIPAVIFYMKNGFIKKKKYRIEGKICLTLAWKK